MCRVSGQVPPRTPFDRGGGYTALAMVADSHPIHHPPKTKTSLCRVSASAAVETTARRTAQTIAHPML